MADGSKVVSLKGDPIVAKGTPRPEVIETLEGMLDLAHAGELDGFAAALLFKDDCTSYRISGRLSRGLIGVLEMAKFQMLYDDMKES